MQLFKCQNCAQVLYFENTRCERCACALGYLPERGTLSAVAPDGETWRAMADPGASYRFCVNWEKRACNWMVEAGTIECLCLACRHNRVIPDLSDPERLALWRKVEEAKRRLFYSLLKLRLPTPSPDSGDAEPLVFDILADPPDRSAPKVMTGHDNGVITFSLTEAGDAERERVRTAMGEPYRTLLGHFRHEVGHYYWDRLIRDRGRLDEFRHLFGEERADYGEALQRHHQTGPTADWQDRFVSAYATMHPWEDWAESWAHYLHIVDTLEMAGAFGVRISPEVAEAPAMETEVDFDPHRARGFQTLIDAWLPLTYAVNCLNRSMGQPDLYPFVLPPAAIAKLEYIHTVVREQR
ncbi:zinc-binding metallopeptidase family protein [Plastoroseomonas hellenica]|uniref:zinc-binding metallopeptidase family protein n=1 Tax=Plastoroseomonas hellenica TaxID=2687306 RepID=UPI001BAD0D74|nr:putative zinc-binding peptidase [Plastoroseomonas hellenica]MBR0641325.1 hypothetical protein [Plastoroseomonas hellenica]